jgi:hypothetical protein
MAQKASLIGGVIVTTILDKVLDKVLAKVAESPHLSLDKKDVTAVKEVIVKEVNNEVEARDKFATNNEPAYKSPVTIGSFGSFMIAVGNLWTIFSDGSLGQDEINGAAMWGSVVLGSLFALWGRWMAKRPLGE